MISCIKQDYFTSLNIFNNDKFNEKRRENDKLNRKVS